MLRLRSQTNRMRLSLALATLLLCASAFAQDAITLGDNEAASGATVSIPVSILDRSGNALGADAGAGNRIQGFAFKVFYPTDLISSVAFARAGITQSLTPMYENHQQGVGWTSYIASFSESIQPIPFTQNAAPPGNVVGMLTVTMSPSAPPGSIAVLRIDPPSAILSNQSASARETVANTLTIANGSILVTGALAAPANVVATANGTTQVNVSWTAAANADHYDVYRASAGAPLAFLTSTSSTTVSDMNVAAGATYFYRVRSVNAMGLMSGLSDVDAATTVVFTDDPVMAGATLIKLVHVTELRNAVNAFRAAAGLAALPADGTIGAGAVVRAQHVNDVRNGLNEARAVAGLPSLSFTDSVDAGVVIRAVHVQELRTGVR